MVDEPERWSIGIVLEARALKQRWKLEGATEGKKSPSSDTSIASEH